jgi:hypothetical protein
MFISASFINYICLIRPRDAQILRLVGRSETQYDIYIYKMCFCLSYKYGITSIQLPWLKRHLTNHIWGELLTSTTICPSNDQRAMRRGFRSVPSRGLPTIDSFGFVNNINQLCFMFVYQSCFVLLYFFFCPLYCLFLFNIRILITPLLSSNSSRNAYFISSIK